MARRTRKGEEKITDTSSATLNKNPKYPQIWYDTKKLENPYKTETTTSETTTKSSEK